MDKVASVFVSSANSPDKKIKNFGIKSVTGNAASHSKKELLPVNIINITQGIHALVSVRLLPIEIGLMSRLG